MSISPTKRLDCYRRDGFKCVKCGAETPLTVDHVIPRSRGGKDWLKNLQTLCKRCNWEKGDRVQQFTSHKATSKLVESFTRAAR